MVQTVQWTMETPQLLSDKVVFVLVLQVVDIPFVTQRPITMVMVTIEILQLRRMACLYSAQLRRPERSSCGVKADAPRGPSVSPNTARKQRRKRRKCSCHYTPKIDPSRRDTTQADRTMAHLGAYDERRAGCC